ncbi:MAG: YceI family protein [Pseudomonadota bacterium]
MAKAPDVPAGNYKVDPAHASVTWKVNHLGLSSYTARFTKFTASLEFDPADMAGSILQVTIDPKSIKTDFPFVQKVNFDEKLAEDPEYFNANAHPEITFASTKVEMESDTKAKVSGDLTLLGVTKPVTLDVTLNGSLNPQPFVNKPALGFSGSTTIKRSEFGFTKLIPSVGDDVELLIEAEFLGE